MNTNAHESRNDFILSLLQIMVGALITLVCVACGFVLFRQHIEGGAYFLGLVSGSPAAALTYQLGRSVGEKKAAQNLQTPVNIQATAQAGEPDTSSVAVSTSPSDANTLPSA